jgi:acetoin:2,6-dichlorophenolindophenol oxidoreductase subunit alpha
LSKMIPRLPKKQIVELFRTMLLIRRFEENLIRLNKDYSFGNYHVYIGQETVGVPALSQLKQGDFVFTTHRSHGHVLARGADPGKVLAEIIGKEGGYSRGRGGTLHVAPTELGFPMTSSIVGGSLILATGAGMTAKQNRKRQVSVCLFGDSAMEEGAFYEAMNLAALRSLPVVYLCENNSAEKIGGLNLPKSTTNAARKLTDIVKPFQIPAKRIDGGNVRAVYEAMENALKRARSIKGGPSFIEVVTSKWPIKAGNPLPVADQIDIAMIWDKKRIPNEQKEFYLRRDGLIRFAREGIKAKILSKELILSIDNEAQEKIKQATKFALDSPWPRPEEAVTHVFA